MAEKISFKIDLTELANYTHTEGLGGSSLLKMDGFYMGKVTKIIPQKAQSGNYMWLVQQVVEDTDEKGAMLLRNVLCSGKDKNGDPLSRQLGQFLEGVGMDEAAIRALAANGSIDADGLAEKLIGRTVFFSAEAETYEGKMTSKVQNYVTKRQYDDAVAANAHRKPRRADVTFAGPPAGVVTGPANVGGPGAGIPANGAGKAANPLQALAGLNLNI